MNSKVFSFWDFGSWVSVYCVLIHTNEWTNENVCVSCVCVEGKGDRPRENQYACFLTWYTWLHFAKQVLCGVFFFELNAKSCICIFRVWRVLSQYYSIMNVVIVHMWKRCATTVNPDCLAERLTWLCKEKYFHPLNNELFSPTLLHPWWQACHSSAARFRQHLDNTVSAR